MLKFTFEMGLSNMDIHHVLEEKDEEGNTALHFAASAGLEDCVEVRALQSSATVDWRTV